MFFNSFFAMAGAAGGGQAGGGMTSMLLMFGLIFVIMYFLMIRPQQKRQKKHDLMINSLVKNDKVVTIGGMFGVIQGEKEKGQSYILKIADNVKVEVRRSAIAGKVEEDEEEVK
ncbi:preprotein translocase subunit YajC [bacterium]|nr:preprotein translocase subunit YajC [bacterium]